MNNLDVGSELLSTTELSVREYSALRMFGEAAALESMQETEHAQREEDASKVQRESDSSVPSSKKQKVEDVFTESLGCRCDVC